MQMSKPVAVGFFMVLGGFFLIGLALLATCALAVIG